VNKLLSFWLNFSLPIDKSLIKNDFQTVTAQCKDILKNLLRKYIYNRTFKFGAHVVVLVTCERVTDIPEHSGAHKYPYYEAIHGKSCNSQKRKNPIAPHVKAKIIWKRNLEFWVKFGISVNTLCFERGEWSMHCLQTSTCITWIDPILGLFISLISDFERLSYFSMDGRAWEYLTSPNDFRWKNHFIIWSYLSWPNLQTLYPHSVLKLELPFKKLLVDMAQVHKITSHFFEIRLS